MATAIVVLVLCQIGLGVGTWLVKYNWPTWLPAIAAFDRFVVQEKGFIQGLIITAHVAVGSLILAGSFSVAMGCFPAFRRQRSASSASSSPSEASYRMEALA
jgi:cytochrome c oxidase assembly protein subunit 15